jgi:hypothetical protein
MQVDVDNKRWPPVDGDDARYSRNDLLSVRPWNATGNDESENQQDGSHWSYV